VPDKVVKTLVDTVGDLDRLEKALNTRPGALFEPIPRRIIIGPGAGQRDNKIEQDKWVEGMKSVLAAIRNKGLNVDLSKEQEQAARAITVLWSRPALLIRKDRFALPPDPWSDQLERYRTLIQPTFKSVGKIELRGDTNRKYAGTGFVVAKGVVMTNRHVVQIFCDKDGSNWKPKPGVTAQIDFIEEYNVDRSNEFAITEVLGVFPEPRPDLALLAVESTSSQGKKLPKPLPLASNGQRVKPGLPVYAVGYPARDTDSDTTALDELFGRIFDVKRMAPGQVMSLLAPDPVLLHDCSTLGGNSGSCLLDVQTQEVVGLHFGGVQWQANTAVALWELKDDPLLKEAGVNFV
jgi:S1-C subfamily serine protease